MSADLISDLIRISLTAFMIRWWAVVAISGYARLMAGADEDTLNVTAWIDMALGVTLVVMGLFLAASVAAGQM